MLKLYNSGAVTRQQRFGNAVLVGVLAAAGCIAVMVILGRFLEFYEDLLYVGAGYLIGWLICRYGKGVQIQFALLAVGLTLAVIVISDVIILGPENILPAIQFDPLFSIGYRVVACIIAWQTSRIAS